MLCSPECRISWITIPYIVHLDAYPLFIQVFQRRIKGVELFYERSWQQYKQGFGDVSHEYWLGNDVLNDVTSTGTDYIVRVELIGESGTKRFAEYSNFRIGSEADQYMLLFGSFLATSDVGK